MNSQASNKAGTLENGGDRKRAAVYVRTAINSDESVARQIENCQRYAAKAGAQVVCVTVDDGVSGTTTEGRAGLTAMLRQAQAREFDVLIVESTDRLSRDMTDLYHTLKLLERSGIVVADSTAGEISDLPRCPDLPQREATHNRMIAGRRLAAERRRLKAEIDAGKPSRTKRK